MKRIVVLITVISLVLMPTILAEAKVDGTEIEINDYNIVKDDAYNQYIRISAEADANYEKAWEEYIDYFRSYVLDETNLTKKDEKVLEKFKKRCFNDYGFSIIKLNTLNRNELIEEYGMDFHKLAKDAKKDIKEVEFFIYDELYNSDVKISIDNNMTRSTIYHSYSGYTIRETYMSSHAYDNVNLGTGDYITDFYNTIDFAFSMATAFTSWPFSWTWTIIASMFLDLTDDIDGWITRASSHAVFTDKLMAVYNDYYQEYQYAYFAMKCNANEVITTYYYIWDDVTMSYVPDDDDVKDSRSYNTTNYYNRSMLLAKALSAYLQGLTQGESIGDYEAYDGDIEFTHSNPF